MRVVIFKNPDDTITVRNPVRNPSPGSPAARRPKETEDEHFERLVAGPNRKGGTRVAVVEHTELPAGHEIFKLARRWDGAKVIVDMPTARALQAERIEQARKAKARELLEREVLGEDVTAEKAVVRGIDSSALVNQATTPGDLAARWPAVLST